MGLLSEQRLVINISCKDRSGYRQQWLKTLRKKTNKKTWCWKESVATAAANDQPVILTYWAGSFRFSDAKETRWRVHCVCVTFSAITFYGGCGCKGARQAGILAACTMGPEKNKLVGNRGKKRIKEFEFSFWKSDDGLKLWKCCEN